MGGDTSAGVRGRGVDLGNGHCVVEFVAPWGKPVARWEPSWGEAERVRLEGLRAELVELYGEERTKMIADTDRNLVIFPNLLINDALSPVIRTSDPLSPNMTHITQWSIGPTEEPRHVMERRLVAFNTFLGPGGFATPDDIEALEGCQRSFEWHDELPWSDYSRGYAREIDPSLGERQSDDEVQLRAYYRRWQGLLMSEE
jgi:p-cumate 2,3-dioxygenase alpha subunit